MLNRRQLEKPFPEQLYIGGSTFFIGSRRRWSGLFSVRNSTCLAHLSHTHLSLTSTHLSHTSIFVCLYVLSSVLHSASLCVCLSLSHFLSHFCCLTLIQGLIRQLVLMPGSDASSHLCPSSDPTMSILSVPQILLHLPGKPPTNQLPLYPYGENEHMLTPASPQCTYAVKCIKLLLYF